MAKAALRVSDKVICVCKCKKGRCPNGKITTGVQSVIINNRPAAVQGSITTNCCGSCCPCPNQITRGSATVFFAGKAAARVGDPVRCGLTNVGSRDVFIG